jgi:hypothetical protein
MGYQDRDYRKDSIEPPLYVKLPQLGPVIWLLIISAILSIIEYDPKLSFLTDISFDAIFSHGHIWAIALAPFAPDFGWSLIFDGLLIFFISRRLIQTDGLREYLMLYISSAVFGMLMYWGFQRLSPNHEVLNLISLDAATWSLCGIGMVYAVRNPNEQLLLYFVLPIKIKWFMSAIVLIMFFRMASLQAPVAFYIPMLGALGLGYLYAFKRIRISDMIFYIKRFFGKKRLPLIGSGANLKTMSEEDIRKEVDRLLDKITASENGVSSLTAKERDFLMKSSKRHQ